MKKFDQINMIPFIDIMLVLLAIVLTTASFVRKGLIQIDLPNADEAHQVQDIKKSIQISLDGNNIIFYEKEMVNLNDLDQHLAKIDSKSDIQLRIDKSARFEGFIEIIRLLKRLNLENFSIETQFPQS